MQEHNALRWQKGTKSSECQNLFVLPPPWYILNGICQPYSSWQVCADSVTTQLSIIKPVYKLLPQELFHLSLYDLRHKMNLWFFIWMLFFSISRIHFQVTKGFFPVYQHSRFWKGLLERITTSFCSNQDHGTQNAASTLIFDTSGVTSFPSGNAVREEVRLQLQILKRQQLQAPARPTWLPSGRIWGYSQVAVASLGAVCHRKLSWETALDVLGSLLVFSSPLQFLIC